MKLELPTVSNIPLQTKPENIVISVDSEGKIYWNDGLIPDKTMLLNKLVTAGGQKPQPEVHIRGDANARYEHVGRVVNYCQKRALSKLVFNFTRASVNKREIRWLYEYECRRRQR